MKIKDLPPKLRGLAERRVNDAFSRLNFPKTNNLAHAFNWDNTPEGEYFWSCVAAGYFEDAYKLRPDLREPSCSEPQNGDPSPKQYDYINPDHYKKGDKEVWEMMVDIWGVEKYIAHCEMCAYKYLQRLGKKPGQPISRDLQKASWYLNKVNELRDGMD